ncbi:MAG: glutamate-cysteine ligase family protein, partial [Acidimicrobiia bacterium]|nr:glutamate-cysteine ligase family protein [Acidimicrobiia bacterium]
MRSAARGAFRPSEHVRIGAEIEWLVYRRDDLSAPVTAAETATAAAGVLPAGGTVTVEPGGQLEVSTRPFDAPEPLLAAIAVDAAVLVDRFARHGLALVNLGYDPIRAPLRTLEVARYIEMDRYFRARSPAGVRMMNATASLQLNVDFGPDPERTWKRAHAIAPVLLAAFANSPTPDGSSFRAASERQRVWDAIDPCRTAFGPLELDAWADYVLDAQVMIRGGRAQTEDLSMRAWLASDDPPTLADVEFHSTTLFPPVRPRGFLELRMIDAAAPDARTTAIAVVWALLTDDDAGAEAASVCATPGLWARSLVSGTEDTDVAAAPVACREIAAG